MRLLPVAVLTAALIGGGGAVTAEAAPTASATAAPTATAALTPSPTAPPVPTTYYVDCSRKAKGDGLSMATAWNSLGAVARHGAFKPGEKLLLRRGTTCKGRLAPTGSGTRAKPILLGAYRRPGDSASRPKPTIAGGGTPKLTGAVQLTDVEHWTVQDLHITNRGRSQNARVYRSGLLVLNQGVAKRRLSGIVVQRLTIDHVWSNPGGRGARSYGGISVLSFPRQGFKSGYDDVRILRNRIDGTRTAGVGRSGIIVSNAHYPKEYDSRVRIAYNSVRWVRGDSIVLVGVKGGRIDHNVSAWGANFGTCPKSLRCGRIGGPSTASAAIWPLSSRDIVIERNEVYGEHAAAGDGEAFDIDRSTRNVVLQYNYAHDNQGGGVMFCGAKDASVRFNILQNNAKAAITFTCAQKVNDIRIYNNTIYQKRSVVASAVVRTLRGFGGTGIRFLNNIVYTQGPGHYTFPSRPIAIFNTFVGTHHRTEPTGTGNSRRPPGLKKPGTGKVGMRTLAGYHLRSLRTAQKGHALSASTKLDFFGKRVNPKAPHRGASNTTR